MNKRLLSDNHQSRAEHLKSNLCDHGLSLLEEVEGVEQTLIVSLDGAALPFGRGHSQLAGNSRPLALPGDVLHATLLLHQLQQHVIYLLTHIVITVASDVNS